ncbi:MAG: hypothetical protein KJZ87_02440 [Thermoguttaceae bacterium]|nr:hypothetical protein [Thermoguttaceae bacterium]
MMQPQSINYLGPKTEVALGDLTLTAIAGMSVWSSREPTADTCEIVLPDLPGDLAKKIAKDAPLVIRHGYKGYDLETIFTGTVVDVLPKKRLTVFGADAMRLLFETKLTITFQDETPTSIIRKMVGDLGIDVSLVTEIEDVLDRLPLYRNTVWQAVKMINDRMGLPHDFFVDETGAFRWEPRDLEQEPSFEFVYGRNILDLDLKASGQSTLLTVGMPVRHSMIVSVTDRLGDTANFYVMAVRHFLAPKGGSRTFLKMERVDES